MKNEDINLDNYKTPSQLVQVLLNEKGWTKRVLATVLGINETGLNHRLSDKRPITADFAVLLEEVFNVRAEYFLELQKRLDLGKARLIMRPDPKRSSRAHLFNELPISEMTKRGWLEIDNSRDMSEIESALTAFFGERNFEDIELLPHAAKKTDFNNEVTPVQIVWLYRVKQIASEMLVHDFSKAKIKTAITKLKNLLVAPEEARHVPKILAECGIRFVIVESLKSAKIDGVCLWLNENSPVIGMTLRFDRMDNFWFVLRHELEHVLQDHGKVLPKLDIDLNASILIDSEEKIANDAASDFCASKVRIDSFVARKAPLFPERDFLGLSKILGVHPSLVAGQIQHKTGRYDLFRGHIAPIRNHVIQSSIVDGFGNILKLGV